MKFIRKKESSSLSYKTDYRDHILYNGKILFRATGLAQNDKIEFEQVSNPENKIFFNTNLPTKKYIKHHQNYDIFRPRKYADFTGYSMQNSDGLYYPTGRLFSQSEALLWEFMRHNDSNDVLYMNLPLDRTQFIFGQECVQDLYRASNFSTSKDDNLPKTIKLANSKKEKWVASLMRDLNNANSENEIIDTYKKMNSISHPMFYYLIGVHLHDRFSNETKSRSFLFKSASYGLNFPLNNWDISFIDPVGQSFGRILLSAKQDTDHTAMKLFSLAYVYISSVIMFMPDYAHDSYVIRARLIQKCERIASSFFNHNFSSSATTEPFIISDLFNASKAYYLASLESEAEKHLTAAVRLHEYLEDISIGGKDACDYSLEEIAALGVARHRKTYDSVISHARQNQFKVSKEEFAYFYNNAF